ncbi:MAG: hypothetical protein JO152_07850 [Mycobacteriaceae bacterium]|nr:hypothetical protein [Mycobacteriaceae bacterium]
MISQFSPYRFSSSRFVSVAMVAMTLALVSACGTSERGAGSPPTKARALASPAPASAARDVAPATPRPPVIRAGRTIRSISGAGNRAIGSLSEKTAIVLQWSSSAQRIQVFTAQGFLLLDSHTRAGRVRLAPGRYFRLRVASPARWTLLLRESA